MCSMNSRRSCTLGSGGPASLGGSAKGTAGSLKKSATSTSRASASFLKVDGRGSCRPDSMPEMVSWPTPDSSAKSFWLQPLRRRISFTVSTQPPSSTHDDGILPEPISDCRRKTLGYGLTYWIRAIIILFREKMAKTTRKEAAKEDSCKSSTWTDVPIHDLSKEPMSETMFAPKEVI